MSEANKALERIKKIVMVVAERLSKPNGEPDYTIRSSMQLVDDFKTIKAALTRLSELEPIIQELVEAHKRYEEAYFEDQRLRIDEPFSFKARVAEDTFHSEKQRFLETAANRIAKIGGV